MTLIYKVTAYVPGREVVLDAPSRLLRAIDHIVVAPDGDGATVSYAADVRLQGLLRILEPILRKGFTAVGDRATAGLAKALSAAQPAAGQASS